MAAVAVTIWLFQGIAGLPLFSGGGGGIGHFVGPTGGYLVAFVLMAFMAGFYVDRVKRPTVFGAFLVGMAGHALCLGLGTAWLALQIGLASAFELGFVPFIVGSIVKSALVAIVLVTGARYLAVFGHRL